MCDQSQWCIFYYDAVQNNIFEILTLCMKRFRSNVVSLRSVQSRIDDVYVDQLEELALYLAHVHTLIHAV